MAILRTTQGQVEATSNALTVLDGEVALVWATRDLTATIPSAPSVDWNTILADATASTGADCAARLAWRRGPFSGTGTWTNASRICWAVYSGLKQSATPIGAVSPNVNDSHQTFVRFLAASLTGGESEQRWFQGVCRSENSGILDNNITQGTNFTASAIGGSGTDYMSALKDATATGNFVQADITGASIAADFITIVVELLAEPAATGAGPLIGGRLINRSRLSGRLVA